MIVAVRKSLDSTPQGMRHRVSFWQVWLLAGVDPMPPGQSRRYNGQEKALLPLLRVLVYMPTNGLCVLPDKYDCDRLRRGIAHRTLPPAKHSISRQSCRAYKQRC